MKMFENQFDDIMKIRESIRKLNDELRSAENQLKENLIEERILDALSINYNVLKKVIRFQNTL